MSVTKLALEWYIEFLADEFSKYYYLLIISHQLLILCCENEIQKEIKIVNSLKILKNHY